MTFQDWCEHLPSEAAQRLDGWSARIAWEDATKAAWNSAMSIDGSISVPQAIADVLELFPGADRQALETLAWALTKPPALENPKKLNEGRELRELDVLLAAELGVGNDYGRDYTEVLLSIGKGMFWAAPFDKQARELAEKVRLELNTWALPEDSRASYEAGILPKT